MAKVIEYHFLGCCIQDYNVMLVSFDKASWPGWGDTYDKVSKVDSGRQSARGKRSPVQPATRKRMDMDPFPVEP
jgi:hypothetical protein